MELKKKMRKENIICRLIRRETFGVHKPGTQMHIIRQFHTNIFPNFSVVNVNKPSGFLRKFSPNGNYLIGFSSDQTSVQIYRYKGPAAAGDLIHTYGEYVGVQGNHNADIKYKIFERFFKLIHTINVTAVERINRECSLFTDDERFVIIVSSSYFPEEIQPTFYEIYRNNESLTPTLRSPLEDYTLYLIDLKLGKLCDTRHFKIDKIFLSHNQGLYLYKDMLAVLSVQHQIIHIFQIIDGMLVDVRKIGRFCYEDDLYLYNLVYPYETTAFKDIYINSLKHRLLAFLFRRAETLTHLNNDPTEIRKFYKYFGYFASLKMWKMQLLDETHILIKYANEDIVNLKQNESHSRDPQYFVVYNIPSSKIIAIYENTSRELVNLLENFSDYFRNPCLHRDTQFSCNPSNNLYAHIHHCRYKHTIMIAKYGGKLEAIKRILATLPISAQQFSTSPYLDYSLFSYDDKWISNFERPKAYGEHPIRFNARDSGYFKFHLHLHSKCTVSSINPLVAFTFHPTDPFAISVQRTDYKYTVNFHIRFDNQNSYPFVDKDGPNEFF